MSYSIQQFERDINGVGGLLGERFADYKKLGSNERRIVFDTWKHTLQSTGFWDNKADMPAWQGGDTPGAAQKFEAQQANNAATSALLDAIGGLKKFEQSGDPKDAPSGVSSEALAANGGNQQAAAQATAKTGADLKASKGKSGKSAADAINASLANLTTAGQGNYLPWYSDELKPGGSTLFNQSATSGSGMEPNDDQVTQWRNTFNSTYGTHYGSNREFLDSPEIQQGRERARSSFRKAFNVGDSESVTVDGYGGMGSHQTVTTQRSWYDAAISARPALESLMPTVLAAAQAQGIPWQMLYGVLRARMVANPGHQTGVGMFNVKVSDVATTNKVLDQYDSEDTTMASILYLAQTMKQAFDQTGDWGIAALATDDPNAALALRYTGKHAAGREGRDNAYLQDVIGSGKSSIFNLGFGQQGDEGQHLLLDANGNVPGAGGQNITVPDDNLLRQNADQIFRSLMFRAPSEQELQQLVSKLHSTMVQAQVKAQPNPFGVAYDGQSSDTTTQDVNPQAWLQTQVQNTPEYQSLYAHRGGKSEADYAGQFQSLGRELLGPEGASDQTLREGMMSGNLDTFRGLVAGEGMQSQSFRQKLYQTAQMIAQVV